MPQSQKPRKNTKLLMKQGFFMSWLNRILNINQVKPVKEIRRYHYIGTMKKLSAGWYTKAERLAH